MLSYSSFAVFLSTIQDTCDGDAGGPMVQTGLTSDEDVLVGITSFGTGCADPDFPGVYTRLSFYADFITDAICELADDSVRPGTCPTRAPSSAPTITGAPTGPTSSPAPSASPAPSMEPTRKKNGFCFSGENTVETESGVVRMDELQLGDRILSGEDNFEEVYSFGHFSEEVESEYLQVFTEGAKQPLELSADHMLFLENDAAVAAADVSVGDKVMLANGEVRVVESVESVTRQGVYAPFTESGTVSVNGVKASSFVAFQDESFQTPFSDHVAAHMSQLPQRVLARFGITCNSFNAAGVNACLEPLMKMHESFRGLPSFMLAPFIAVLALLYGVEQYPVSLMAVVGGVFLYRSISSRKMKQA